jgi:DNA-binding Lrp family transcriptional regulator
MDEIDNIITKKLIENCRVTYRELAEITDMSVSSIHKRINKLVDEGNIKAFVARPSIIALKSIWFIVSGTSKAKSVDDISKELGQHENIDFVCIAGGKFMYIAGYLRNISELQELSTFISKNAQISEPTVGIIDTPYMTMPESLSTIDFKIIKSLNKDARKPITDIADDVGLSANTVRKRLDRMINNHLITLTAQITNKGEGVFDVAFHIHLNEGADMESTIKYLNEKYSASGGYCFSFSNIPNFIQMHTSTKTVQESQKIQEELQKEGFKDVVPHILLTIQYYDCWIEQLLRTK